MLNVITLIYSKHFKRGLLFDPSNTSPVFFCGSTISISPSVPWNLLQKLYDFHHAKFYDNQNCSKNHSGKCNAKFYHNLFIVTRQLQAHILVHTHSLLCVLSLRTLGNKKTYHYFLWMPSKIFHHLGPIKMTALSSIWLWNFGGTTKQEKNKNTKKILFQLQFVYLTSHMKILAKDFDISR